MALPVVGIYRSTLFNWSETFVQDQAAALTRYRPLVIGLARKGSVRPDLEDRLCIPGDPLQRFVFRWFGHAAGVARALPQPRPCLLHAHFGTDGLVALALARRLKVPLITTLRGFDVGRTRAALLRSGAISHIRYALFRRHLQREGSLFLAVSDYLRKAAVGGGYPADRILTHYNGVDLGMFAPRPDRVTPGLVLHVGRLVEKKGTGHLIRAFARIAGRHPGARLAIVGEGPLRASLERLSRSLGIGERVDFAGHLPHAAIRDLMQRAWVLAAPSRTGADNDIEGLPNVVVEAAASGLPAIVTRHSGLPEAVEDGQSGFVVEEDDEAALAERLSIVLGCGDVRHAMARRARALAEQRFDRRVQNDRLQSIYDRVLERERRQTGFALSGPGEIARSCAEPAI